jgi:hypothetical protein
LHPWSLLCRPDVVAELTERHPDGGMFNGMTSQASRIFIVNVLCNLHQFAPIADQSRSVRVPIRYARPIEVDGVFLGTVVEHERGVRFIAVDDRVTEMDQSLWPNLDCAHQSALQLFRFGRAAV